MFFGFYFWGWGIGGRQGILYPLDGVLYLSDIHVQMSTDQSTPLGFMICLPQAQIYTGVCIQDGQKLRRGLGQCCSHWLLRGVLYACLCWGNDDC